jgi:glutamine amidotransferase
MSVLVEEPVNIAVLDYGMGNRRSVEKALAHVGARASISSDHDELHAAAGLVVPGVGAFPRAMERLREQGLICLGLQLAFDYSSELGGAPGLGLIAGEVHGLRTGKLKLPHIGWNEVTLTKPKSPLVAGLPRECAFYHVHSLAAEPEREEDVLGVAEYGAPFVTAVEKGSFYGVQFHAEKSSAAGLRLLANFAQICIAAREPSTTHA